MAIEFWVNVLGVRNRLGWFDICTFHKRTGFYVVGLKRLHAMFPQTKKLFLTFQLITSSFQLHPPSLGIHLKLLLSHKYPLHIICIKSRKTSPAITLESMSNFHMPLNDTCFALNHIQIVILGEGFIAGRIGGGWISQALSQ